MNPNEEQFDDFKVAEETSEMGNAVANAIVAKELPVIAEVREQN